MLKAEYPYYLANKPVQANKDLAVHDKYSGDVATRVAMADSGALDQAIAAAHGARHAMAAFKPYQRRAVLEHCVERIREQHESFAKCLSIEAGKPITQARAEVDRLLDTFRLAADEAIRIGGEVLPLEVSERAAGYEGMWRRVPVGPCAFITPFNFPLNLVAHKIAPAIAAGCPFVLKPAGRTPLGALMLGELLAETELPEGAFSILPLDVDDAGPLVEDERLKLLSFTGSQAVGWKLKEKAGRKKVTLELGGNAAVIVDAGVDLDDAVDHIKAGAFGYAGQSCISVQRVIVQESVYDEFTRKFTEAAAKLKWGDPAKDDTVIGPVISGDDADRILGWIQEARDAGARVLCGGNREGNVIDATVLDNVPGDQKLACDEAFGPVAVLSRFSDFDDALAQANDSQYGLQAGVFTRDIEKAWRAWETLEVGGVLVNEVPSWRVDHMPYGGVKESGLGREGVRFAIEEMTEIRLFVIRRMS